MEQRISFITLGVADLDRAEAFYRALGWVPSAAGVPGQIVFFQLNGIVMGLFRHADLAADAGVTADPPQPFRGTSISHNVREEGDVDLLLAKVVEAGARVVSAPHKAEWGGRIAYFSDPDGHLWEICHNPFMPLSNDGGLWLKR